MTTINPQSPSSAGSQPSRPDDSRLRDPLGTAPQQLKEDVRQVADAGERALNAGLEKVSQGASAARRAVEQGLSTSTAMSEDWMCTLKKTVEAHPVVTIAAAVGVGMLLDRLLSGSRH